MAKPLKWGERLIVRCDQQLIDDIDEWRLQVEDDTDMRPMSRSAAVRFAVALLSAARSQSEARRRLYKLLEHRPPLKLPRPKWDID